VGGGEGVVVGGGGTTQGGGQWARRPRRVRGGTNTRRVAPPRPAVDGGGGAPARAPVKKKAGAVTGKRAPRHATRRGGGDPAAGVGRALEQRAVQQWRVRRPLGNPPLPPTAQHSRGDGGRGRRPPPAVGRRLDSAWWGRAAGWIEQPVARCACRTLTVRMLYCMYCMYRSRTAWPFIRTAGESAAWHRRICAQVQLTCPQCTGHSGLR